MNTTSVVASISRNAGGLQQSVRRLHQCLNEIAGVKVSVAALLDEHSIQDMLEWAPLPVSLSPVVGMRAFGYAPRLFPKLIEIHSDISHTHGIWQYPSIAVNRWHEKTRRPYLISPHGMLDPWAVRNSAWKKKIALTFYERKHLEKSACIRALCKAEAQAIRQFGLRNPICIIPNGIDLPAFQNSERSVQNVPWHGKLELGKKVLLYLGRIHPKKGLVNLIKAWANLRPSDWVLAIAGWDQAGHEDELKCLATELGITWTHSQARKSNGSGPVSAFNSQNATLIFLGPQFGDSKASCYANCDAFILPSFSEGLPMVVLEAWAYGKPVIMTSECNLPEGFAAEAAIKIEPNAESIIAGVKVLIQAAAEEINAWGNNGRSLVASRFNWPRAAREMIEVYRWLLGAGPKPDVVI